MKTINFEKLEVHTDIDGQNKQESNVKKDFANLMYQHGKGIEFHALAMKIYNSKGEEEYSEDECKLIKQASLTCAPFFIDAISDVLNSEDKHENNKE